MIAPFIRRLQGERPGMGSQLATPDRHGELLAAALFSPSILIETSVRIADVSYYQADINMAIMAQRLDGVIIRAGQRNWPDIRFRENRAKAKAAGLPWGSYWFYDSREDPKKQAALWWSQLDGDVGQLVHVADLEESYGGAFWRPEHFKAFITEFQRLSGLPDARIAIYTGYYWWQARVGADTWFRRYPLWLAWYSAMSVVRIPAPWREEDLLMWQWTSSGDGLLHGVSSLEIDLNWYCCSQVHYRSRFNLGGGEIPPVEEPMADTYVKGTTTAADSAGGLRVRNQPNTSTSQVLGALPFGTPVEGWLSNGWIKIVFEGEPAYISADWVNYQPAEPPGELPAGDKLEILKNGVKIFEMVGTITLPFPE